jgi:hypothetical protein
MFSGQCFGPLLSHIWSRNCCRMVMVLVHRLLHHLIHISMPIRTCGPDSFNSLCPLCHASRTCYFYTGSPALGQSALTLYLYIYIYIYFFFIIPTVIKNINNQIVKIGPNNWILLSHTGGPIHIKRGLGLTIHVYISFVSDTHIF